MNEYRTIVAEATGFRMGYLMGMERQAGPELEFSPEDRQACEDALARWRKLIGRLHQTEESDAR